MKTTCGLFLINKHKQILICHPTGMSPKFWSIPKGIKESCESHLKAAWREMTEETGIHRDEIIRGGFNHIRSCFGTKFYTEKPKCIVAFGYNFNGVLDKELVCNSTFFSDVEQRRLPEVDRFKWLHYEHAAKYLNDTQQQLIVEGIKLGVFK